MSEVKETMEDFASELEASYKEYDARRNNAYQDQEGPDAEKWAELAQQMEDKTVLKVKVKEAVKGGLVAYVDDIQGSNNNYSCYPFLIWFFILYSWRVYMKLCNRLKKYLFEIPFLVRNFFSFGLT